MKVAVQSYSLREELNVDFEGTIRSLRKNGFEAYEMGVYFGDDNPHVAVEVQRCNSDFGKLHGCIWSAEEAERKIPFVRAQGIVIESCHLFFETVNETALIDNLERIIVFAKKNDIKQIVISYMLTSWESVESVLGQLTKASEALEAEGIHLAYHNHDKEMLIVGDKTILEKLLDLIPTLSLQPDIGWMRFADGPIQRILRNYSERIYSVHFKDLLVGKESDDGEIICTPIGDGDVDSQIVIPLLKRMPLLDTGLIIDQDNSRSNMLKELKRGREYIIGNIFRFSTSN